MNGKGEGFAAVWRSEAPDGPTWYLSVVEAAFTESPGGAKYATQLGLLNSVILRSDFVQAGSKEEAILKYAASGRRGRLWSAVPVDGECGLPYRYRLVKEDF